MTSLGGLVLAGWVTNVIPRQSTDLTLREIVVTDLTAADAGTVTVPVTTPTAGTVGSQSLPGNCAFCVSLRSAFRGRSSRGRIFIAGLPESSTSLGRVDAGLAAEYVAAIEAMRELEDDPNPWSLMIVSKRHNNAWRTEAAQFQVQAVTMVDTVIDSQRRRLIGRGQ